MIHTSNLFILRHAQASKEMVDLSDFDRPLTEKGIADALELGKWMADQKYFPQTVLCSPALRTKQTWEYLSLNWKELRPQILFLSELYQIGVEGLTEILFQNYPPPLMVIGHNPGLEDWVQKLCAKPLEILKPCGLCLVSLKASTSEKNISGELIYHKRPTSV